MKGIRIAIAALFAVTIMFAALGVHAEEGDEAAAAPEGQQQQQIKPAETAHPRFMKEYALWCYNILSKEDDIRLNVIDYLKEKAAEDESGKLAIEDISQHSMEIIVHLEEKMGIRMGAFKVKLGSWAKLDDKEKQVYGSGLRLLSGYLASIEVEEAKKLGLFEKEVNNEKLDAVKFKRRLLIGLAPYRAIELTDEEKKSAPSFIGAIIALDKSAQEALDKASGGDSDE